MAQDPNSAERRLADMPSDQLRAYAGELGMDVPKRIARADLLRSVRARRELLVDLDHRALLDIVKWARQPVRRSDGKEQLARVIAGIDRMDFEGLSREGLVALARLRGVPVTVDLSDEDVIARLTKAEGMMHFLRRKRRRLIGWAAERIVEGGHEEADPDYQFLPEDPTSRGPRLRDEMEHRGVVAGLAGKLRGAADDYIAEKLDEIEHRIDEKLDEIDARLGEWRDREVTNRLRIIKITIAASVVVALLSLGYKYAGSRVDPDAPASRPAGKQVSAVDPARGHGDKAPPRSG